MRAGGCTFQQGLTQEATNVVKQAVTLAKCRGHAQVTPLHVAKTLLSSSTGLFRTACLQSHSHPLQCKALELCFNVALNRLPASSNSSPMLGNHHYHLSNLQNNPSISNALVAAFKRAQAHQRRGSIENQQQPLLALKIELEQLIISILDDPSVSRVMREAGFSSTQVKINVEQAVSLELCSSQITTTKTQQVIGSKVIRTKPVVSDPIEVNEDISSLIQSLVHRKKKSVVIVVGECVSSIEEKVIRGLMKKVEYKEDSIPEGLREVKFITLALSSFGKFSKAEVENEIRELKSVVRGNLGKGIVLYLGDFKWATEYIANTNSSSELQYGRLGYYNYSPVEHMVMELGKMAFELNASSESCGRFWLLGIATFQTYMRCKSGHPSLETILGIHPLTIPSGSLRLSLVSTESESMIRMANKNDNESMIVESGDNQIGSFVESSAKFEVEAKSLCNSTCKSDSTTNQLPAWLQQCKNEIRMHEANNIDKNQSCVQDSDLCKNWNSFDNSTTTHNQHPNPSSEKTQLTLITSVSASSSASGFSHDQQNHQKWPIVEPTQSWTEQQHFWASEVSPNNNAIEPLRIYIPEHNPKQPFSSNPNSTPTSVSSSDLMEITDQYSNNFKQFNTENFKTLCEALEIKVPRQKEIIPEIVNTILKCRAGDIRRKGKRDNSAKQVMIKEETWLLFQGVDFSAKEKIARELGRVVFGNNSQNNFVSITLSRFSSTCSGADSTEDCRVKKRCRDEQSCSYIERFAEQVFENPHRVFLLEDIEEVDYCSQLDFKKAIERGKITTCNGEEIGFGDAIVILSCESLSSRSRACSPPQEKPKLTEDDDYKEEISPCVTLDLNISFEDDENDENEDHEGQSIDEIGLIHSVDRRVIFKMQGL